MRIMGCDFHTRFQQMAMLDTETGELMGGDWSTKMERRGGYEPLHFRKVSLNCSFPWRSSDDFSQFRTTCDAPLNTKRTPSNRVCGFEFPITYLSTIATFSHLSANFKNFAERGHVLPYVAP